MRILFLAMALVVVAACGGGTPASTRYTQTWTKAYDQTTCADWGSAMDEHQRFVMAADMLLAAQRGEQADAPIPPDSQIQTLQTAIGGACAGAGAELGVKVGEVAASLYLMSNDLGRVTPDATGSAGCSARNEIGTPTRGAGAA